MSDVSAPREQTRVPTDGTPRDPKETAQEPRDGKEPSSGTPTGSGRTERPNPNPDVTNEFHSAVTIESAVFGPAYGPPSPPPRAATGLIDATEIRDALTHVVHPDAYATAASRLRERHAVVLEGMPGSGRYTGALALLDEVAGGDIHRLDPTLGLKDLSEVRYTRGQAYLVLDHVAPIPPGDADYVWSAVRSQVTKADAYLVLTRTPTGARIQQVAWERPPAEAVLAGMLDGAAAARDLLHDVTDRLPDDWTLTGLAKCAERLRNEPDVDQALDAFNLTARKDVADWFVVERSRDELIEITALAFLRGTSERRFERFARALGQFVDLHHSPPEPAEGEARPGHSLPLGRRARTSTLVKRVIAAGPVPRRILDLPSDEHWRAVVGELQAQLEAPFWAAVQDWIIDILNQEVQAEEFDALSQGITALATWDAEEALSVLDLLAEDVAGPLGRGCAVTVLGLMSTDKALAPLALMIAVRWLGARSRWHRLCAGAAFIGELGITFPAEGARRLWQLIAQDRELSVDALSTPAWLFAALVARGGDAAAVLDMVLEKLDRFAPGDADPVMVSLAAEMALWLLFIRDARTKQSRALDHLVSHPEDADRIARIWAALLCNRRTRLVTFDALWEAMRSSPDLSTEGVRLAESLATALPPEEHDAFIRDLRVVEARRRRRPDGPTTSLAEVLIAALRERAAPITKRK